MQTEFIDCSLESLQLRNLYDVFLIAIKKSTDADFIFIPGPNYILLENDIMVVIGKQDGIKKLQEASQQK